MSDILNPETSPETIIGQDGNFAENWQQSLGDEFKDNQTLANTKSLKDLASQVINSEKLIGRRIEEIIPKQATPDQQVAFLRKHLGASETADSYTEITKPADWPDNIPFDQNLLSEFKKSASEIGLLPFQAKKAYDLYMGLVKKSYDVATEADQSAFVECEKRLKEKYQNRYDEICQKANAALHKFGGDVGKDIAEKYGKDPFIISLLANVAEAIKEDTITTPKTSDVGEAAEAQAKINKIMSDEKHPYQNKNMAGHAEAVEEVKQLFKKIYPDG